MKTLLLFVITILGLISTALGQKRIKTVPVSKEIKGVNENCFYKARYSAAKRFSFYPFNISDSVVLVSFRHHEDNYLIKGDLVVADSLIETKPLNKQEIDQLTD